jgi:formylmethanofuran dehydrogenase subunit A
MSKKQREHWLEKVHKFATERSTIAEIEREYSLYDIALTTRAAPAKILGLEKTKGHLGIGADADIAVYGFNPEKTNLANNPDLILKYFLQTQFTFKGGQQVSKNGIVGKHLHSRVLSVHPELNEDLSQRIDSELEEMMSKWFSHSFSNYPVPTRYREHLEIPTIIDSTSIQA